MKKLILSGAVVALVSLMFACKKKSSDPTPNNPNITVKYDTSSYFKGTVDGVDKSVYVIDNMTNIYGTSPGSSTSISTQQGSFSSGSYSNLIQDASSMDFHNWKPIITVSSETFTNYYGTPSDSLFTTFFTKSSYKLKDKNNDGFVVSYYIDGKEWSSFDSLGTMNQTGSTISLSDTKAVTSFLDGNGVSTIVNINCNIFDQKGNKKKLEGKFFTKFNNM